MIAIYPDHNHKYGREQRLNYCVCPHPQPFSHAQRTLWEKEENIKISPLHLWRGRHVFFTCRVRLHPYPKPPIQHFFELFNTHTLYRRKSLESDSVFIQSKVLLNFKKSTFARPGRQLISFVK